MSWLLPAARLERLGWLACDDRYLRPRLELDDRKCGLGILYRNTYRDLGCTARWTQHWVTHAHSTRGSDFVYFLGHGDINHVILLPGSVNECFEFGWKALDLAEHYQTPIFVLSDLDLGMNQWITPKFAYPDRPIDRGKILWEEDLDRFGGQWGRYKDIDADGIPYRTVMGNQNPAAAYFTRGTGHNEYGNYSEDPINWANMIRRIKETDEHVRGAAETNFACQTRR